VTGEDFRKLALSLPQAVESEHMDHPDFRVGGKIFATLTGRDEERGMVKLTPGQQAAVMMAEPAVYSPGPGVWGRRGGTWVDLRAARRPSVEKALRLAWRNTAPKRLLASHPDLV
jgi:hypothetical protein